MPPKHKGLVAWLANRCRHVLLFEFRATKKNIHVTYDFDIPYCNACTNSGADSEEYEERDDSMDCDVDMGDDDIRESIELSDTEFDDDTDEDDELEDTDSDVDMDDSPESSNINAITNDGNPEPAAIPERLIELFREMTFREPTIVSSATPAATPAPNSFNLGDLVSHYQNGGGGRALAPSPVTGAHPLQPDFDCSKVQRYKWMEQSLDQVVLTNNIQDSLELLLTIVQEYEQWYEVIWADDYADFTGGR